MLGSALPVSEYGHILITCNPQIEIRSQEIIHKQSFIQCGSTFSHEETQRKLQDPNWRLEHVPKRVSLIGAWLGSRSHEDALRSAFGAIEDLGVNIPDEWHVERDVPLPPPRLDETLVRLVIRLTENKGSELRYICLIGLLLFIIASLRLGFTFL